MKKIQIILTMALLLVSMLSACQGAGGVLEIQVEETAQDRVPESVRQVAIKILQREDFGDLIQFRKVACVTSDGLGGPPKCGEGKAEGTIVEVFPIAQGEGFFVTPETIDTHLDFWVKQLYAVYQVANGAEDEPYWPAGEYALLFERDQNEIPFPITFYVEGGKIVRMTYHLGVTVSEQLNSIPVEQVVVSPMQVENWLAGKK